jgi:molybdenum cofactor guanylyltransferase
MTANGTLGLILAGGRGSRIGGRDKAWLRLAGRPLLCHARERLAGQVDSVAISANRHLWCYRSLGLVATPDPPPWRHCGPLAGIATALATYPHTYLAVVPVDVPMAPRNHVAVLARALAA